VPQEPKFKSFRVVHAPVLQVLAVGVANGAIFVCAIKLAPSKQKPIKNKLFKKGSLRILWRGGIMIIKF